MVSIRRMAATALAVTLLLTACDAGETAVDPTSSPGTTDTRAPGDATDATEPDAPTDTSEATTAAAPAGDDALTIGLVLEPVNLDFTTTDGAGIPEALLVNVYETLVKLDESGEIVPLLASDWTVSDDGMTYDFTLVEDATFSNGDTFDADDVKFSIEAVQDDWTVMLKSGMDVVESVEVVSPTQVRVQLSAPSNNWLFLMTTRIGAMFSPDGVDDLANEAIGTGPYQLDRWVRGDRIEFSVRDDYWGDTPAYDQVTLRYFADGNALNNALLSTPPSINVIGTVQAPEALGQFEGGDYDIIEGTTNGEVVLSLNNANPPLDDVRVRQAIRYAIDNEAVMATAWAGYGTLIGSMVPPTDPWYEDRTGDFPLDQDQARSLLADAGASDANLVFKVPNVPYATAAAQTVQSNLAEVGITAEIETVEFPVWLDEVFANGDYHMSIVAHVEPRDIASFANPDFYWAYDNAQVQQLLADADTGTPEDQVALTAQAAEIISQEAASEFLFLAPSLIVTDGTVTGLPTNDVGESFDLTRLAPTG